MKVPKISIALITYNGGKYLRAQLDSIRNQSVSPYELVICDDMSSDNTLATIEEYMSLLPIKLIRNENRLGVNKNFEKAIGLCTGDYIAISDQDDCWLSNKLEISLNQALLYDNSSPILVRTNSKLMNDDMSISYGPVFKKEKYSGLYKRFFQPNAQGAGMLFNEKLKSIILPFPNDIHSYDFYIGLMAEIYGKSVFILEPLMLYRIHSQNAVGIREPIGMRARIRKMLTHSFSLHNPGAFRTLDEVRKRDYPKMKASEEVMIKNILDINSSSLRRKQKLQLIWRNRMATLNMRILLSLKLILAS